MLGLSRRKGQEIRLYTSDGVITLKQLLIKPNVSRLGIDAPANVRIIRAEVDDQAAPATSERKAA